MSTFRPISLSLHLLNVWSQSFNHLRLLNCQRIRISTALRNSSTFQKDGQYMMLTDNSRTHEKKGMARSQHQAVHGSIEAIQLKPLPPYERAYISNRVFERVTSEFYYEHMAPDVNEPKHIRIREYIDQILSEYEMAKLVSQRVPSKITVKNMETLIDRCFMQNVRDPLPVIIENLYQYELRQYIHQKRKEITAIETENRRREQYLMMRENEEKEKSIFDKEGCPIYSLWKNNMFFRINPRLIARKNSESKLRRAALFGSPLIIDLSWANLMSYIECESIVTQLMHGWQNNRNSADPFDLWFVNVKAGSKMANCLYQGWKGLKANKRHCINIVGDHYLDLFDKERLVYVTPTSKRVMSKYKHDKIYILGGIMWKPDHRRVMMSRAREEGIEHIRLPLERKIVGRDNRNLCVDHIVSILCKAKEGVSINEALIEGIPQRKMRDSLNNESTNQEKLLSPLNLF